MKRQSAGIWLAAAVAGIWLTDAPPAMSQVVCERSSGTQFQGTDLDTGKVSHRGIAYASGTLTLNQAGGDFQRFTAPIAFPTTTYPVFAAAGSLDLDGRRDDFVAGDTGGETRVYLYNDSLATPQFEAQPALLPSATGSQMVLAVGDFDGNDLDDIFRAEFSGAGAPGSAVIWPQTAPGVFGLAQTVSIALDSIDNGGTTAAVLDYNGDRRLDLLIGGSNGQVQVFLNDFAASATFRDAGNLGVSLGWSGTGSTPVFAFEDFDGDDIRDLVAGAPSAASLRLFRGRADGSFDAPQSLSFAGNAIAVLAADFSRDGRPDLLVATDDSGGNGGQAFFYENESYQLSRMNTPFTKDPVEVIPSSDPLSDFDMAIALDHDGDGIMDYMVADGTDASSYVMFDNQPKTTYAACGEAISDVVDLGTLASTQMRTTAVRITPQATLNGGKVQFYASAEDSPLWVAMNNCGDGNDDVCVRLPASTGNTLRWKARLCSKTDRTATPSVTAVEVYFDHIKGSEHYLSGIVVDDGVAYIGGLRQPGNRGSLYAARADLDVVDTVTGDRFYWEAGAVLDDFAKTPTRAVYTADPTGTTKIELSTGNLSSLLAPLSAASTTQAQAVVEWALDELRFTDGATGSRFGAIATSTPAVVTKPGLPIWYSRAGTDDRNLVDNFIQKYSTAEPRKPLVLVGAKDGMLHAFYNNPLDTTDAENGKEKWAFIPPYVARHMVADYTGDQAGPLRVSAYPDGSPTLVDIKNTSGEMITAALLGSGKGGKSITALDVTDTLVPDPVTSKPRGPEPMWSSITPGGADAGQGYAKPVVARVEIGGAERFITIVGTGIGHEDAAASDEVTPGAEPPPPSARGRIVAAYDMADGSLLWRYRTVCPLTSEIAVFETDDDDTAGVDAPELDGFADRAVFGDACGYVYKVDPALDLGNGWNPGIGPIPALTAGGTQLNALFSTRDTLNAQGVQRPIAGNLAARADDSTRIVLFFGTGGLEQQDPSKENAFYSVYADTGELRDTPPILPGCPFTSPKRCVKFYGGVIVNAEQVISAQAVDPLIGEDTTCGLGDTTIVARDLNSFATDFSQTWAGMLMNRIYSRGGALYFTTSAGEAARVGTPQASEAGGETVAGIEQPTQGGEGTTKGTNDPLFLLGWQQVY